MPIQTVSLGLGSERSRHGPEGDARFINCYAEKLGPNGKTQYPIYAIDGLTNWATLSDDGVRSMLALESTLYAVVGRSIIAVDPSGAETVLGGIIGDGLVTMARNTASSTQVGICVDGLFKIAEGTTLVTVTDADLPPANSICHIDRYFVLTIPDGRFFITGLNDGDSIDALDFARAEASPDGLVRGAVRNRDLVLFGNTSTEFWQNVGGADFPFARTTSMDRGCLSGASVVNVDQTLAWVADDGTVRVLNGYQGQVISTGAVERAIDDEANKAAITGIAWERRGHVFYALSGTDWTWVYDLRTGQWHERQSYGLEKWRCSAYAKFDGRHVFGDATSNKLYREDPTVKTEGSDPIVLTVQMPVVHAYPNKLQFHRFFADVVPGTGINSSDTHDSDPLLMLSYSEDGGATWSTERQLAIGEAGARKTRLVARRLGMSKEDGRIFRLSISANVTSCLIGAAVDIEVIAA